MSSPSLSELCVPVFKVVLDKIPCFCASYLDLQSKVHPPDQVEEKVWNIATYPGTWYTTSPCMVKAPSSKNIAGIWTQADSCTNLASSPNNLNQ